VGLGLEYAGAILLLGLLGHWWFDDDQGTPWGLLVGALIGFTGATYNLIKIALKANRDTKD
jgi:F0F1-type ATP synthase assembly protein I